jgi:hypothetical protein
LRSSKNAGEWPELCFDFSSIWLRWVRKINTVAAVLKIKSLKYGIQRFLNPVSIIDYRLICSFLFYLPNIRLDYYTLYALLLLLCAHCLGGISVSLCGRN